MKEDRHRMAEEEESQCQLRWMAFPGSLHEPILLSSLNSNNYHTGNRSITALNHWERISLPTKARVIQTPRAAPMTQKLNISVPVLGPTTVVQKLLNVIESTFANGTIMRKEGCPRITPRVATVARQTAAISSERVGRRKSVAELSPRWGLMATRNII